MNGNFLNLCLFGKFNQPYFTSPLHFLKSTPIVCALTIQVQREGVEKTELPIIGLENHAVKLFFQICPLFYLFFVWRRQVTRLSNLCVKLVHSS